MSKAEEYSSGIIHSLLNEGNFTYEKDGVKTQLIDCDSNLLKLGDRIEAREHVGHGSTKVVTGRFINVGVCGDLIVEVEGEGRTRTLNISRYVHEFDQHISGLKILKLGSKYMSPSSNVIINTYVRKIESLDEKTHRILTGALIAKFSECEISVANGYVCFKEDDEVFAWHYNGKDNLIHTTAVRDGNGISIKRDAYNEIVAGVVSASIPEESILSMMATFLQDFLHMECEFVRIEEDED